MLPDPAFAEEVGTAMLKHKSPEGQVVTGSAAAKPPPGIAQNKISQDSLADWEGALLPITAATSKGRLKSFIVSSVKDLRALYRRKVHGGN
jgi:hypothetical protein